LELDVGDSETPASKGFVNVGATVTSMCAGQHHTCVVTSSKTVRCWGNGSSGRLGYGNSNNIGDNETPASAGDVNVGGSVESISCGESHTCAVLETKRVRCWGNGGDGRLGYGNTNSIGDNETPASVGDVEVGGDVASVVCGKRHTCAVLVGGTVRCWGHGSTGALGYRTTANIGDDEAVTSAFAYPELIAVEDAGGVLSVLPEVVGSGGRGVLALSAGRSTNCVLLWSYKMRCWGDDHLAELGNAAVDTNIGDTELPYTAGDINTGFSNGIVVSMATSDYGSTCAIGTTKQIKCWGTASSGELGSGAKDEVETPGTVVSVGGNVISMGLGYQHMCVVLDTKQVKCWGSNSNGQLGYGNTNNIGDDELPSTVGVVSVGGDVSAVTAGVQFTCALLTTKQVKCWGRSTSGKLGYGNAEDIGDNELPSSVGTVNLGGEDVIQLSSGWHHSCALMATRRVRCWGSGGEGRLGYGNTIAIGDDELPSTVGVVSSGGDVVAVSCGGAHTCVLLATRRVRCWGSNNNGQLGLGHRNNIGDNELPSTSPEVALDEDVIAVEAGNEHTCVLLGTREVRCWGSSNSGRWGWRSGGSVCV
jgi:alpha-tubulin suppressor-like RCC1 family protein